MKANNTKKLIIIILSVVLTISVVINIITASRLMPYKNEKYITKFYYKNKDEIINFVKLCNQSGVSYIGLYENSNSRGNIHNKIGIYYIHSTSELSETNKNNLNIILQDFKQHYLGDIYVDKDGILFVFDYGFTPVGLLYDISGKTIEEIKNESYYDDVWAIDDNWYIVHG